MKELDPHNSALIERLKLELKETTSCDDSWHSGVNDGMYRLLQYLVENKLIVEKLSGEAKTPDRNTAWSERDVMKKLLEASNILFTRHDYDGQGYENIKAAMDEAAKILKVTGGSVPTPSDEEIEKQAREDYKLARAVYKNDGGVDPGAYCMGYIIGAKWVKEWLRSSTVGNSGNKG